MPLMTQYNAAKFALDGYFGTILSELTLRNKDVSITTVFLGGIGKTYLGAVFRDL